LFRNTHNLLKVQKNLNLTIRTKLRKSYKKEEKKETRAKKDRKCTFFKNKIAHAHSLHSSCFRQNLGKFLWKKEKELDFKIVLRKREKIYWKEKERERLFVNLLF